MLHMLAQSTYVCCTPVPGNYNNKFRWQLEVAQYQVCSRTPETHRRIDPPKKLVTQCFSASSVNVNFNICFRQPHAAFKVLSFMFFSVKFHRNFEM